MRLSRSLCSLALACLVSSFGFVALCPCDAYADDIDFTKTYSPFVVFNSSDDWRSATVYSNYYWDSHSLAIHNDKAVSNLTYIVPNIAGEIRTSTIGGKWLWYSSEYLNGNYSHAINGNMQFTGYVSNTEPLMFGDMNAKVVTGNYIYMGMSYYAGYIADSDVYRPYMVRKGQKFRIMPSPRTFATCSDNNGTDYTLIRAVVTNYQLYVRDTSKQTADKIEPDSNGIYTIPYDATYLILVFRVDNNANFKRYLVMDAPNLIMLDDNVKNIVETQTDQMMSTDGSNNITSDAITQGQQIVQDANFVEQTGQFVTATFNAFNGTNARPSLIFPGLTIMGYTIIPQQNVALTGYLGTDIENRIRDFVTMILFLAWIMGLRSIYHRLFLGEVEVSVDEE